ncbi:hypothetical protein [Streptomyces hintoniae]|uniref:hypothetical protein n=1 Tax=Streptomyces hintoniae TaxID=3075521 RepID=UPI003F68B2C0
MSPRLRAGLYAAEAEICARAGLADDCNQALDRAVRLHHVVLEDPSSELQPDVG